jgi:transcriptional regulator
VYVPTAFKETRSERLHAFVQAHPFATVLSQSLDGLAGNHLPFELAGMALRGHVARGNELAQRDGTDVLAIFHGPNGYVSPNWYPSKHETGRAVPTWNYAVVHVYGRLRVIEDKEWLRRLLNELTQRHEAGEPKPWRVSDAPADYVESMLGAIVGLEIAIERFEGKFKLSQNHPMGNRENVIAGLKRRDNPGDRELAALMQDALN